MITFSVLGVVALVIILLFIGALIGFLVLGLAHAASLQDEEKQDEHPEIRYF